MYQDYKLLVDLNADLVPGYRDCDCGKDYTFSPTNICVNGVILRNISKINLNRGLITFFTEYDESMLVVAVVEESYKNKYSIK